MNQNPATHSVIRLLCVEDHALVREGIGLIIEREPDMKVVGEASTVDAAVALFTRLQPDVTLMDLQLGVGNGVDAIRSIRAINRDARIIVLTVHQGEEDIYQAMAAGATTYLLKDTLSYELIRAIREVFSGGHSIAAAVEAQLQQRSSHPRLTSREIEVLQLVSRGLRNRQVGESLGIAEETVQVHVRHILEKLKVDDRTAATTVALRRGIIHLS